MGLIDTHSHLHAEDFDQDRDAVLARARQAGVDTVFLVGEDASDNERVLATAARTAALVPCLGLHPDRFASAELEPVLAQIRAHADRLVAVGEVGLDYWRAKEEPERATQRRLLAALVTLAREQDLTLNVHSRSAGRHTLEFLQEHRAGRVHMHAFDGRAHFAADAAAQGVFFSLPPSLLRSPQTQKLARRLPLECLLLESDAPVLGPEAGQRNEPGNLARTLEWLARERGVPEDELTGLLEANTRRAYPRLAALRAQRGHVPRVLPACFTLLVLVAALCSTFACQRAPAPAPRDLAQWEELDPMAQAFLVQHPVFEGFLSTREDAPEAGYLEVLSIVRRDHEAQVASAFDPVLPDYLLQLATASGVGHRQAAEQILALLKDGDAPPSLQELQQRDPAGFRRRLVRAFLARVGEDPEDCTPERLTELLLATQANWSSPDVPVGAVQLFRRSEAHSLARVFRVLELAEEAGLLRQGMPPRVLWVRPGVDVLHPALGVHTQVLVPEPLWLAGCLIQDHGVDPDSLSIQVCHPDFRVVELLEWAGERLRDRQPLRMTLHEQTAGSPGLLATRLQGWREAGVSVQELPSDARGANSRWELQVPASWGRGIQALCADPIVERVGEADRYDLVLCPDLLEELPPAVQDLLLLNLRRLCRPRGLLVTSMDLGRPNPGPRAGWQERAATGKDGGRIWFSYEPMVQAP